MTNYYIFVTCGLILILAGIIWFLAIPTVWRIGLLIASGLMVAVPMYMGWETSSDSNDWREPD